MPSVSKFVGPSSSISMYNTMFYIYLFIYPLSGATNTSNLSSNKRIK